MTEQLGKFIIKINNSQCGIVVAMLLSSSSSSERAYQKPSEAQKQVAYQQAQQADINVTGGTVIVGIKTKPFLDTVDSVAIDYYCECLYQRTLQEADKHNIPYSNLMTMQHIRWEIDVHIAAYYLGFDNAEYTELNVDETWWTLIQRALGFD